MWNFLKEISTNGDMQVRKRQRGGFFLVHFDTTVKPEHLPRQARDKHRESSPKNPRVVVQTMDVVYPASPMMLYTNPELLRLLLVPVLNFANNGTSTPFTNPFSPHQIGAENDLENGVPSPASLLCLSRACLGKSSHFHFFETLKQRGGVLSGTYPIADATTASQEPMPMENTGAKNATCTLKRTFYQARLRTNIGNVEEKSGVFRRQYVPHARRDCPADARCGEIAFLGTLLSTIVLQNPEDLPREARDKM